MSARTAKKLWICTTHNHRMQCWLMALGLTKMSANWTKKIANCSYIEMKPIRDKDQGDMVSMKLFRPIENISALGIDAYSYSKYTPETAVIPLTKLSTIRDLQQEFMNSAGIYIVRHGQGVHNTLSKPRKMLTMIKDPTALTDAKLTPLGWQQARAAGKHLYETVVSGLENPPDIQFISSDMRRAYQTCAGIIEGMREMSAEYEYYGKNMFDHESVEIKIRPCLHELNQPSDKCDDALMNRTSLKENTASDCAYNDPRSCPRTVMVPQSLDSSDFTEIKLNWDEATRRVQCWNEPNIRTALIDIILGGTHRYNIQNNAASGVVATSDDDSVSSSIPRRPQRSVSAPSFRYYESSSITNPPRPPRSISAQTGSGRRGRTKRKRGKKTAHKNRNDQTQTHTKPFSFDTISNWFTGESASTKTRKTKKRNRRTVKKNRPA